MASEKVEQFLKIDTIDKLAAFLSMPSNKLTYYAFGGKNFYTNFCIPKRDMKGVRQIDSPSPGLKKIQKVLSDIFNEIYVVQDCVYGFVKGKSIGDNAIRHVNKKCVVRIDLKDFFPSITAARIRGLFKSSPFNFNDIISDALTNLVCHKGHLPQGSPASPVLSNMICYRLDRSFMKFARSNCLKYTRYADDLIFSSTKKAAVSLVATASDGGISVVSETIRKTIESNGFEINGDKTGIYGRGTRQVVTGIVVNRKCNFKRSDYRYLRSLFHFWSKDGVSEEAAARYYVNSVGRKRYQGRLFTPEGEYIDGKLPMHVRGLLDYYSMIESVNNRKSEPLLKLWTSYYDLISEKVPEMIPERSILKTDSAFKYRELNDEEWMDGGSVGTVFILKDIGIMTAQHCIKKLSSKYAICDEEYYLNFTNLSEASTYDSYTDVASFVLEPLRDYARFPIFEPYLKLPGLSLSDEFSIQRGEKVIGYGFANGQWPCRRIEAYVSEIRRDEVIVDRAFIKGMSGGPVLNARGLVIGIITGGSSQSNYDHDGRFILLNTIPVIQSHLAVH